MASSVRFEHLLREHFSDNLIKQIAIRNSVPVFVLITSKWCPDCISGAPRVQSAIESKSLKTDKLSTVVTIDVGTRPEWRDQDNTLRSSPLLQVTNIPTLYYLDAEGNVVSKLVEKDTYEPPELLDDFLAKVFGD